MQYIFDEIYKYSYLFHVSSSNEQITYIHVLYFFIQNLSSKILL